MLHIISRIFKVIRKKDFFFYPQHSCPKLNLGNIGANWVVAPDKLNSKSIVYSFGVGTDVSFDLSLIQKFNLTVHAFDPTPKSIEWVKKQNVPSQFVLHEYGLANYDGKALFNPPSNPDHVSHSIVQAFASTNNNFEVDVYKLKTIMEKLGHQQIDLLKMDIEGSEYDVIDDIINSKINISQILIEFHHRFESVTVKKSKDAIKKLNLQGYKVFDVSPTGEEFSFILVNEKVS